MADSSQKKIRRSEITHKAWSLVRMALLWGRKGGVFKRRWPLLELRSLFSKHLKALTHLHLNNGRDRYLYRYYGERQLSFDETPLFNVKKKKMHRTTTSLRFLLPCIDPPVDFDYDFEMDGQDCSDEVESYGYDEVKCDSEAKDDDDEEEEEKGVDVRAEEFIAKFYEQIKLQRQISYFEYKQRNDAVSIIDI